MHLSTFITRSKAVAMAIMACSFVGSAETFTLETAGTLAELIGDRKYEITELKVVGPISNADIANNGNVAVVTDEAGYKSAITVYNIDNEQLYK